MSPNYFQASPNNPYHISIGAVVRNAEGKICCHYFKHFSHPSVGTFDNFYILMRETLEPVETLEQCLVRGLMEEFGVTAKLERCLGSIVSHHTPPGKDFVIEKTTLYFFCDLISIDEAKRKLGDPEGGSEIKWLDPVDLMDRMKDQYERLKREDANEAVIISRVT